MKSKKILILDESSPIYGKILTFSFIEQKKISPGCFIWVAHYDNGLYWRSDYSLKKSI